MPVAEHLWGIQPTSSGNLELTRAHKVIVYGLQISGGSMETEVFSVKSWNEIKIHHIYFINTYYWSYCEQFICACFIFDLFFVFVFYNLVIFTQCHNWMLDFSNSPIKKKKMHACYVGSVYIIYFMVFLIKFGLIWNKTAWNILPEYMVTS